MIEKDRETIYSFRSKLESVLGRLDTQDVGNENAALIARFARDSLAKGLAPSNVLKYVSQLKPIARILEKPFPLATKQDIIDLIGKIETMDYTKSTRATMKTNLKLFYRWLRGTEEYPDEVRWIVSKKPRNSIAPGDLLTAEEVERMIGAAVNLRDKALISVLYESACRPQEILPLRLKQVQFDEYGVMLTVDGKIGVQRTLRLIASTALLSAWLNVHPRKSDPDAPLFPNFYRKNPYQLLQYSSFKVIIKAAAKKAGIQRRIFPYLFRHSRLTELTRMGFTGFQFNLYAGWSLDSKMGSTYIHLQSKDVDDAILRLNGVVKDRPSDPNFKAVVCPRCRSNNSPGTKLCLACGHALDLKTVYEIEGRKETLREKIEKLSGELAKSPEIVDSLLEALALAKANK